MNSNYIFEKFHSGFHAFHSTETALLRVTNDLLIATDAGFYSVLILLDFSAAFDTVNHKILINHLNSFTSINGIVLDWFNSYLTNRSFSVEIDEVSSSSAPLICGVPQGAILGPLLFSIYILPLGQIIQRQFPLSLLCRRHSTLYPTQALHQQFVLCNVLPVRHKMLDVQ
ncbi:hypothetical protein LDENG_00091860 [Lucifuga dentata]|nr:hypothetical protein LDENG_00091860 [Lucifuga dentata]